MLRITPEIETPACRMLKLEGKLVGPWVATLAEACREADAAGKGLCLDLRAVSFVDGDGVRLLRELRGEGVEVVCSGLVARLLAWEAR
jgi:hypothetical protein